MGGIDADGHGAVLVDGSFDRRDVARGDVDVARDLGQHLRLVVVAQAVLRHPGGGGVSGGDTGYPGGDTHYVIRSPPGPLAGVLPTVAAPLQLCSDLGTRAVTASWLRSLCPPLPATVGTFSWLLQGHGVAPAQRGELALHPKAPGGGCCSASSQPRPCPRGSPAPSLHPRVRRDPWHHPWVEEPCPRFARGETEARGDETARPSPGASLGTAL